MIVSRLRLRNVRNHADSYFEFGTRINLLLGSNGEGKTNVLEALSFLSLTRSFFAAHDSTVLRIGEEEFEIDATVDTGVRKEEQVQIRYDGRTAEKSYLLNGIRQERPTSVIGLFPVVILSPEKNGITLGGPGERRKFIDLLLSQLSRSYFDDLLEYRRILRQRNRILSDMVRAGGWRDDAIEPWTAALVHHGGRITQRRLQLLSEFQPYVREAFEKLTGSAEVPALTYQSASVEDGAADVGQISRAMARRLEERKEAERRRGISLAGPHRDELELAINGKSLQQYASQGQHKTFLIALKIAEGEILRERTGEDPMLLLDDVFSELDEQRSARALAMVSDLGQAFITATEERVLGEDDGGAPATTRRFRIEHGTARPA
jgi:DNA replication and repair protein RecF